MKRIAALFIISAICLGAYYFFRNYRESWVSAPGAYEAFVAKGPFTTIASFNFDSHAALKVWSDKIFHGRTSYKIASNGEGDPFLAATSDASSSALYQKVNVDLKTHPQLVWEWKVIRFPKKELHKDLGSTGENDFAGRVYAIFEGSTIFSSEVIQYVWDDQFPEGTFADSGFSGNVKMLVVESGVPDEGEGWALEHRDLDYDYRMLFGKEPRKKLGAIAFMSDSDNTRTDSEAHVRFMKIVSPAGNNEEGDKV